MYVLFLFTVKTFGKTLRILMPCLVQLKMAKIKESQIEMDKIITKAVQVKMTQIN